MLIKRTQSELCYARALVLLHPCTMCTLHSETSRLLATEGADTEDRLQDKISYVWCQEKVGW